MAKSARSGDMSTRITVKKPAKTINANGVTAITWASVFTSYVRCKWVNSYGVETVRNNRLDLAQYAVATMRYTSLIDETCRIWKEADTSDATAWEVVSINDVEDKHAFIEIYLRRAVVG